MATCLILMGGLSYCSLPKVGKRVIVIGAEKILSIDIQCPAAYKHEIDNVKALGGEIRWPVFTEEVTV